MDIIQQSYVYRIRRWVEGEMAGNRIIKSPIDTYHSCSCPLPSGPGGGLSSADF